MRTYNTYENGFVTFILYKASEGTYVAGCNELCLLVENNSRERSKEEIIKKAQSYVCNVMERNLGEHLLNQTLPDEIIDEFYEVVEKRAEDFERWIEPLRTFHFKPSHLEAYV